MSQEEHAPQLQQWHASRTKRAAQLDAHAVAEQRHAAARQHPARHAVSAAQPVHDVQAQHARVHSATASLELEGTGYEQLVAHVAASIIQQHWQRRRARVGTAAQPAHAATLNTGPPDALPGRHPHVGTARESHTAPQGNQECAEDSQSAHLNAASACSSMDNVDHMLACNRQSQGGVRHGAAEHAEALLRAAGLSPVPKRAISSSLHACNGICALLLVAPRLHNDEYVKSLAAPAKHRWT